MEGLQYFWKVLRLATIADVIDVLLVAYLLYRLMRFLRNTSAQRLLQGLLALLVVLQLSDTFELHVINFILSNIMQIGFLALVVIFQPSCGRCLERVGSGRISSFLFFRPKGADAAPRPQFSQTVEPCRMSRTKTGGCHF